MLSRDAAPDARRLSANAGGMCSAIVRHAHELARLADGGRPTADSLIAAAELAAEAGQLVRSCPLSDWWQGWAENHASVRMDDLAIAARYGTAGNLPPAGQLDGAPLDVGRAVAGMLDVLAVGVVAEADASGATADPATVPALAEAEAVRRAGLDVGQSDMSVA